MFCCYKGEIVKSIRDYAIYLCDEVGNTRTDISLDMEAIKVDSAYCDGQGRVVGRIPEGNGLEAYFMPRLAE